LNGERDVDGRDMRDQGLDRVEYEPVCGNNPHEILKTQISSCCNKSLFVSLPLGEIAPTPQCDVGRAS